MNKVAIIPCAGLGTRMGMKPNESKEMLFENTWNRVIDYSLNLCREFHIKPVIISRMDKEDLNNYIKQYYPDAQLVLLNEQGKEWPNTVLKSHGFWEEKNILILPDTRFNPRHIVLQMNMALDKYPLVFATHKVQDPANWSMIESNQICEKPSDGTLNGRAWGLIAFKKDQGELLFNQLSERHIWHVLNHYISLPLRDFKDITRTGKITDV